MKKNNRFLVVVAHPDDEVLGCGATIAKKVLAGAEAELVVMTNGITGRHNVFEKDSENIKKKQDQLGQEMLNASKTIGYSNIHQFAFPDNRLDTIGRMDLTIEMRKVINKFKPSTIFTHHPGDYNWDHTITFDAVMMAARHTPDEFCPSEIFTFEVPSSTERSWQTGDRSFHPNVYVDVKDSILIKKNALNCYFSELRAFPHPRSLEGIEFLSRKRGSEVGLEYAEAFCLIRKVDF